MNRARLFFVVVIALCCAMPAFAQKGRAVGTVATEAKVQLPAPWEQKDILGVWKWTPWLVESVRQNKTVISTVKSNAGTGAAVGGGVAVLLNGTPIGVLTSTAFGALVGSTDTKQIAGERAACMILAVNPQTGERWDYTFIGDDRALKCSLAQPGDIAWRSLHYHTGYDAKAQVYRVLDGTGPDQMNIDIQPKPPTSIK